VSSLEFLKQIQNLRFSPQETYNLTLKTKFMLRAFYISPPQWLYHRMEQIGLRRLMITRVSRMPFDCLELNERVTISANEKALAPFRLQITTFLAIIRPRFGQRSP
jgi:hypothetical protein